MSTYFFLLGSLEGFSEHSLSILPASCVGIMGCFKRYSPTALMANSLLLSFEVSSVKIFSSMAFILSSKRPLTLLLLVARISPFSFLKVLVALQSARARLWLLRLPQSTYHFWSTHKGSKDDTPRPLILRLCALCGTGEAIF